MSSYYHAGQYNEPFKPTNLRNWRFGAQSYPGRIAQFSCKPRCPTRFIACDNGHMYHNIPRNACSSPWGDYRAWVWEEKIPCACVDRLRNPQLYTKPQKKTILPRFFKKKRKKDPSAASLSPNRIPDKKCDNILEFLKKLKLPIIWVLGFPTTKIEDLRSTFCRSFAEEHKYAYIDLDDFIPRWKERQAPKFKNTGKIPPQIDVSVEPSIPIPYSTPTDPHHQETDVPAPPPQLLPEDYPRIAFNPEEKLTLTQILDLLKFAMVESLPAKGFVIADFPLDIADASEFDKTFYPATLGLCFTESFNRNLETGRPLGPMRRNVCLPNNYRRKKSYSYARGQMVVEVNGNRIISIMNTETITNTTLNLLNTLLDSHMAQYRRNTASTAVSLQRDLENIIRQSSSRPIGSRGIIRIGTPNDFLESRRATTPCYSSSFGVGYTTAKTYSTFDDYSSTPRHTTKYTPFGTTTDVPSTFYTQESESACSDDEDTGRIVVMDTDELPESEIGTSENETRETETPSAFSGEQGELVPRIKKRRTRFTKLHDVELKTEDEDMAGGDENVSTATSLLVDDERRATVSSDTMVDHVSFEELLDSEDDTSQKIVTDSDWSVPSECLNYYSDDWEDEDSESDIEVVPSSEESDTENKNTSDHNVIITELDVPVLTDDSGTETDNCEGGADDESSSTDDRCYSPDPRLEKLMTAAKISVQSSSNESMGLARRNSRGRSRIRRKIVACPATSISQTVLPVPTAPVAASKSLEICKDLENLNPDNVKQVQSSMGSGDVVRTCLDSN